MAFTCHASVFNILLSVFLTYPDLLLWKSLTLALQLRYFATVIAKMKVCFTSRHLEMAREDKSNFLKYLLHFAASLHSVDFESQKIGQRYSCTGIVNFCLLVVVDQLLNFQSSGIYSNPVILWHAMWVTLAKSLNLSESSFLFYKMGKIIPALPTSQCCCEDQKRCCM